VTVSRRKRRTHRIPGASVRGARRTACRRSPIPAESGPGGRGRGIAAPGVRYALWRSVSRGHYRNRRHGSQTKYLHRLHAAGEWGNLPPAYFPGAANAKSESPCERVEADGPQLCGAGGAAHAGRL